jgi:hypothetical protein
VSFFWDRGSTRTEYWYWHNSLPVCDDECAPVPINAKMGSIAFTFSVTLPSNYDAIQHSYTFVIVEHGSSDTSWKVQTSKTCQANRSR